MLYFFLSPKYFEKFFKNNILYLTYFGEMAEWSKAHAWKACKGVILSWVRIPFSPPSNKLDFKLLFSNFMRFY